MSFGNELKDFVQGFQSGYDWMEKREDRKLDRAERAEDRKYRRERDAVGDQRWQAGFDYNKNRDEINDNWRSSGRAHDWEQNVRDNAYRDRQEARQGVQDEWNREQAIKTGERQDRSLRLGERRQAWDENTEILKLETGAGVLPDDYKPTVPGADPAVKRPIEAVPSGDPPSKPASEQGSNPNNFLQKTSWTPAGGSDFRPSSGTRTARGTIGMTGPDIAKSMVYDLNRDLGLDMNVGIGLVGQLAGETGGFKFHQEISPVVAGSRGGAGYSQWTGPRRRQFEKFASDHGLDPRSYEANYGFLRHELTRTGEGRILDRIADVRDPIQAGRIFTGSEASRSGFLRPRVVNTAGRDRWTNRVAGLFGGGQRQVRAARGGMIEEQPALPFDEDDPLGNEYEGQGEEYVAGGAGNDDLPPVPTPTPAPRGAIPDPDYGGEEASTDTEPAQKEGTKKALEAGEVAVREGLTHVVKSAGLDKEEAIRDDRLAKVRQDLLKGYGAAPAGMMRRVADMIDPDKKMNPAQRNLAALGNVYNYYMDRGETDKAKLAAAEMVLYHQQAFNQFSALAQAAVKEGRLDDASKAALAAYTNIPDGRDMSIEKDGENYKITFTDAESGEEMEQAVLDPTRFAEQIMKFNPGTFTDSILQAAGQKKQTAEHMDPGKAAEYDDLTRGKITERLGEDHKFSPEQVDVLGDIAFGIGSLKGENNISPDQAARLAILLSSADAEKVGGEWVIKQGEKSISKKVPNSNLYDVKIGGRTIRVEEGTMDEITRLKGARVKQAQGEIDKNAASDQRRSDNYKAVGEGVGQSIDAFRKMLTTSPEEGVSEGVAIPEEEANQNREFLEANPDLAGPAARRGATTNGQTPPAANPASKNPALVRLEEQRQLILSDPGADSPAMRQELARIDREIEQMTGGSGAIPE